MIYSKRELNALEAEKLAMAMVIATAISHIDKKEHDKAIALLEEVIVKLGYEDVIR